MELTALWVRTVWTKKSRGAPGAVLRNAAPVTFALPDTGIYHVSMTEWSDFEPTWQTAELSRDDVSLTEEDTGLLRVHPVDKMHGRGRRNRHSAIRMEPGQWIRWQINDRYVANYSTGEWYYRQETLNLAYGKAEPGVFLTTPTRHIDERIDLY